VLIHSIQPNCMVSGRVFNYQSDFTVMGDNEVPEFVIDDRPEETRRVDVVVEGRRMAATLDGKEASNSRTTTGIVMLKPSEYFPVEITPPEPFVKGQTLGVKITKVELIRLP
jgi:hypothetical protein